MPKRPANPPLSDEAAGTLRYRRIVLAVVVVGCAIAAPIFASSRGWSHMLPAATVRVGVVSAAAWLALPSLATLSKRSFQKGGLVILGVCIVLLALRPRIFGPLLAVAFVLSWWRKRSLAKKERRTERV